MSALDYLGAIRRLLKLAEQDTGGARVARNFLLAWWDAEGCGGFDLTEFAAAEESVARDMLIVATRLAAGMVYPDSSNPVTARTDIPGRIERLARERIAARQQARSIQCEGTPLEP